jgi:RNA ligase
MKLCLNEINKLIELGYLRASRHNVFPISVYNYTQIAQFEKKWAEYPILNMCRGLVLDDNGNVVSMCLHKFHNWEELQPYERPGSGDKIEITLKMDGSLIIVSRFNGVLVFNTRGSFVSDQAIAAEKLFYRIYNPDWIEDGFTYLFEYVAPDNRIVVAYEDENLVHLARIVTASGQDFPRDQRFNCVEVFELNGGVFGEELYDLCKSLENTLLKGKEGFVIRQVIAEPRQNFRMKFKTEDYVKLHKIVTGISNKAVWEMLKGGISFDSMLEICPDELHKWLKHTKAQFELNFLGIESRAKYVFDCVKDLPTRKEQAVYIMSNNPELSGVVFKMLDGGDYVGVIWNMLKPDRFIQPFANKGEE